MFLADFNFTLVWKPRSRNAADAPSCRLDFVPKKGDDTLLMQNKCILTKKHTNLLFHTTGDTMDPTPPNPSLATITTLAIDNSELLEHFKTTFRTDTKWHKALTQGNPDFTQDDNLIFHKGRLFVPQPLRLETLKSRHDSLLAGHPGRNRTLTLVSRDYSWPGMQTYVRRYVEACDTCARITTPRHKPYGLLKPLDIPTRPWKAITMDFIVKLPQSHGYDSIWVVCDRLTRYAHFTPCLESIDAPGLAC